MLPRIYLLHLDKFVPYWKKNNSIMFSLSNLLFLSLASAAPWQGPGDSGVRAIYTLSNDPAGNNILSLALSQSNGTVSLPVLTSTGGKGLLGLNVGPPFGAPGSPAGPDALFSQGSVHVDQNVRKS